MFIEGGRAYKQNGAYFNEYFITDNQGNNRVAFGMLPDRFIYTATMEQSRSAYEESEFSFPANIRSSVQNHTPLGSESVALNGTVAGKEVGPAKVLNITAGDEVDMQAWARYDFTAWDNSSVANIASIVSSAFGGASAGTGGESASTALSNALSDPVASGLFTGNASGEPEAYLQYMFFDANHAYVADGSGFIAVGADAEGAFAKLETGTLTYNEPGYLFIYVVNESNQNADVFFDDLKITHSSSSADFKVSQVNEYYPYGLHTDKSWRHEGYVDPQMMYQAAYAGYDSLTGYYDFLYRSYDPALGQFFAVDPMAGTQTGYSPYHANYNNPVMYVDPLGLRPEDFPEQWPRVDGFGGFGGGAEPNMSSWVSAGLGSSFGMHGYGADYTTNYYGSGFFNFGGTMIIDMNLIGEFGGSWNPSEGYRDFTSLEEQTAAIYDYYGTHGWGDVTGGQNGFDIRLSGERLLADIEGGGFDATYALASLDPDDPCPVCDAAREWWHGMGGDLSYELQSLYNKLIGGIEGIEISDHQPAGETIMTSAKDGGSGSSTTAYYNGIIVDPMTRALPDKISPAGMFSWYKRVKGFIGEESIYIKLKVNDSTWRVGQDVHYNYYMMNDSIFKSPRGLNSGTNLGWNPKTQRWE